MLFYSVDCAWEEWGEWGCEVECGGGEIVRNRAKTGPLYGGDECEGVAQESTGETCNMFLCPGKHCALLLYF